MIPDTKISEIRERADIVEVVNDYVALKRAGTNLKAVCPFHGDKDPSFNVNPARQFYYCFGCHASGDVFSFLQRIEGIDFMDAARRLAGRFGVDVPEDRPMDAAHASARDREREATQRRLFVLEQATLFFEANLFAQDGKVARDELRRRGVSGEIAKLYRLGYAPDSWTAVIDHLAGQGIAARELTEVGLAKPGRTGSFYDAFRNRLMFTVTNPAGQPIAFSGRVLRQEEGRDEAKYINSPETPEYTKGHCLFGLHQARVALSKAGEAILVEGNFDVLAVAMAGLQNVVAPLGTALTEQQAALLRRRVERVVVMFDGDSAGRAAAARAFSTLAKAGLASYIAPLAGSEDPDSLLRSQGKDALLRVVAGRKGLLDQIIEDEAAACDKTVQDAARRIEKMRPYFEVITSPIERDIYRQRLAEAFGVEQRVVFAALRGATSAVPPPAIELPPILVDDKESSSSRQVAERELVGVLLDQPALVEVALAAGTIGLVVHQELRRLLDEMVRRQQQRESHFGDLMVSEGASGVGRWFARRSLECLFEDREKAEKALKEIHAQLWAEAVDVQVRVIEEEIRRAKSAGDDDRLLELCRQKTDLQKGRRSDGFRFVDGSHART